jgi:tetratricopeptide (TPR) repeat protein
MPMHSRLPIELTAGRELHSRTERSLWRVVRGPLHLIAIVLLFSSCSMRAQYKAANTAASVRDGVALMQTRRFAEAEAKFSQAIRLDPHASDAMVWRGICENQLKRYQAAAADFRAALRISPDMQSAHYNLALSLLRLGDVNQARQELEIVTAADPSAVEAQYNLALLLEKHQQYAQAREHLAVALAARPADLGVTEHLLLDDLILKRSAEADELLQHLLAEAVPPDLQLRVGAEVLGLGYFPQAATLLEAAHGRLPASRANDLLLARAYIGSQEDFKAIHLLAGSEAADPSGDTAYLLGLAYVSAGALQEATDAFHAALAAHPRDARSLFQLGLLAERAGGDHRNEALSDLRQAVKWEPGNAAYATVLGRLLLELDNPSEALLVLKRTLPEHAEDGEHLLLLGIAQAATAGVSAAKPTLARAIKLAPELALAHNVLGFCYFSEGHYAEAATAYRQASDLLPGNATFAYDAALAFERAGGSADALIYAKRAAALSDSMAKDHYILGKLYLQAKDRDAAILELKTAVRINPELESPYYLLARTYMQMGNRDEAGKWSEQLTILKQKHNPATGQQGMGPPPTSSPSIASSRLLGGAPIDSDDAVKGQP